MSVFYSSVKVCARVKHLEHLKSCTISQTLEPCPLWWVLIQNWPYCSQCQGSLWWGSLSFWDEAGELASFVIYTGLFLLTHQVFSSIIIFMVYWSIISMSIQRTNKTNWKVLFTLWFFSVFILCLLLLAAGPSPSGAAVGCSSPSPVTWACWVQLGGVPIDQKGLVPTELFTPGYPSCRDRHENLEQYYVLVPCLSRQGFIMSGPGCLPWPVWKPTCHGKQCTGRMLCIWQSLGSLLSPMV